MAKTKQQKDAMLAEYVGWLGKSNAVILAEYTGVTMKDLDAIRAKVRDAGGEFHIVKNTLARIALEKAGMPVNPDQITKSTAMGFAFGDPAVVTKAFNDAVKQVQAIKVKGGYLGTESLNAAQMKALADLPPLPVVQSQLLGVLLAPASKIARLLAEPGRQVASVVKAYSEKSAAPAAA